MKNNSPCVFPPPNEGNAFSLVRKVQGQLSGAGEASLDAGTKSSADTTRPPASPTKQKKVKKIAHGAELHAQGDKNE